MKTDSSQPTNPADFNQWYKEFVDLLRIEHEYNGIIHKSLAEEDHTKGLSPQQAAAELLKEVMV